MNFFQRRKILKHANYLDLHPVRVLDHEVREDGNLNLLMPRFKKRITSALFQPRSKESYIPIKLDRFGSATWLLIDSQKDVGEISSLLNRQFSEELTTPEETDDRVTKFLTFLYHQRYITFTEIQA